MAIDDLNYYSAWLPAGQQTDRYSSQPWCLRSKNLDIFSSSKSIKATAWSEPTTTDSDVIKQDGKLVLKTDWKVYERENGVDTLVVDPSVNFPVYDVCYTWPSWTYAPATWGTSQDMVAKYVWDEWESLVVYTDRASMVYSKTKFVFNKDFSEVGSPLTYDDLFADGYMFRKAQNSGSGTATLRIKVENANFSSFPIRIYAHEYDGDESHISLDKVRIYRAENYYYNAQQDWILPSSQADIIDFSFSWDITVDSWIELEIPTAPRGWRDFEILLQFKWTPKEWGSYKWNYGELYIDMNWWSDAEHMMTLWDGTKSDWDSNYYYSYLPLRERKLVDVWAYAYSSSYWMKWVTFQPFYKWASRWQEMGLNNFKLIYDFVADMWWENDPAMDVIWMTVWNEQVYMIWNLDWNGYIIPCDLTWGRWTPFIAYGCTFKWVTNIDYLMYLVWDDRGISTLWVFNQQELVPIVWGREEKDSINLIENEELYKFDWKIVNWRKNLILTTEDNRIFQYGQTYGGKGGAFIHELPWAIKELKSDWNDLVVKFLEPTPRPIDQSSWADMVALRSNVALYSESGEALWTISIPRKANTASDVISLYWDEYWFTWLSLTLNWDKLNDGYKFNEDIEQVYIVSDYLWVDKTTTYQDDTPIKNYNLEWMAEYPIVIWNHLLEKEESDLFVSYILPSADCSLEFWGMANHYHFRTFTSEDDYTFNSELAYKLKWATWDYELKFIERNGNQYTFRLVWDLPIQTTNDMEITDTEWVGLINYSEYNHFRKIWEITTTEYQEWEFRFHNLNNKLELPKSHSLQVMVKGKGNQNYTPELFALDLVANQRDRW